MWSRWLRRVTGKAPDAWSATRRVALHASGALLTLCALGWSPPALAYDYLEHAFLTDHACLRVQRQLRDRLMSAHAPDDALMARYMALGLLCPERWDRPYCQDDYKQLMGNVNRLKAPPHLSHDYSITLGDYAALPDHLSRFGPIKHLPRAGQDGLVAQTFGWMSRVGSAGGVIEDVAEDACETDDLVPWSIVLEDIEAYMRRLAGRAQPLEVPEDYLTPLARSPVPQGPSDPSGPYSFDNPHYLDLVLRNHHHFGLPAYSTWLGFHSAAVQISARACEQIFALEDDHLEAMARGVPGFEDVSWDDLGPQALAQRGCALLKVHVERRLLEWVKRGDPLLVAPVKGRVLSLLRPLERPDQAIARDLLLDRVVTAIAGLIFEGSGLHFLQDGLASGHMRTIRTRGGLQEVRYDHNRDNREGVVAILRTRAGSYPFVAFGDTFLLGPALPGRRRCDWATLAELKPSPEEITTCLIQHQRGLLTSTSMASLLDWALGGTLYGRPLADAPLPPGSPCGSLPALDQFICANLPAQATMVAGESVIPGEPYLHHGELPVPPPPFSYESLSVKLGMDVAGDATQLKLDVSLLSELDAYADWLTSYRVGVAATIGQDDRDQWLLDLGYHFHWRWAARFTLDAGLSAFFGFRGFKRQSLAFFMGLSPVVGFTILPEGWIKMPLEINVSYRPPVTFFDSTQGFLGGDVFEGHWLYVGFGLAFMQ